MTSWSQSFQYIVLNTCIINLLVITASAGRDTITNERGARGSHEGPMSRRGRRGGPASHGGPWGS